MIKHSTFCTDLTQCVTNKHVDLLRLVLLPSTWSGGEQKQKALALKNKIVRQKELGNNVESMIWYKTWKMEKG